MARRGRFGRGGGPRSKKLVAPLPKVDPLARRRAEIKAQQEKKEGKK